MLPVLLVHAGVAAATESTGRVTGRIAVTESGAPASDAAGIVVYVVGFDAPAPKTPAAMNQKGHAFDPELLPVVVGQPVTFPNLDWDTSHNVFSPDPRFNLGQYRAGRGVPPRTTFAEPGPVEIFCDIHPQMAATILALPNTTFATTAADGSYSLDAVPVGTWDVYAYDRRALVPTRGSVTVNAGTTATLDLAIERTRFDFAHKTWDGTEYGERHYQLPAPAP